MTSHKIIALHQILGILQTGNNLANMVLPMIEDTTEYLNVFNCVIYVITTDMLLINPHMYVNVVVFVYYKLSRLCSVLLRGKSGDNPDPTLVSCLLLGYPSFLFSSLDASLPSLLIK